MAIIAITIYSLLLVTIPVVAFAAYQFERMRREAEKLAELTEWARQIQPVLDLIAAAFRAVGVASHSISDAITEGQRRLGLNLNDLK